MGSCKLITDAFDPASHPVAKIAFGANEKWINKKREMM